MSIQYTIINWSNNSCYMDSVMFIILNKLFLSKKGDILIYPSFFNFTKNYKENMIVRMFGGNTKNETVKKLHDLQKLLRNLREKKEIFSFIMIR